MRTQLENIVLNTSVITLVFVSGGFVFFRGKFSFFGIHHLKQNLKEIFFLQKFTDFRS